MYDRKSREVAILKSPRQNYFDGIGKNVHAVGSMEEAIEESGLNFEVKKFPIQFKTTKKVVVGGIEHEFDEEAHDFPGAFATVRTDTMEGIGIVGKDYVVLQNKEAFDFLNCMTAEATFESAGMYGPKGGKSFITMSTEPMKVMGDEFMPYILFTNSMDGSACVRASFTPIRVGSHAAYTRHYFKGKDTLDNHVTIKHTKNLKKRLETAKTVLLAHSKYLDVVKAEMEIQMKTTVTDREFKDIVRRIFTVKEGASDIESLRNDEKIKCIMEAYNQADLAVYENTAYRAIQAFADYESHLPAFRNTKGLPYKNIQSVIKGMPMTNMVANELMGII